MQPTIYSFEDIWGALAALVCFYSLNKKLSDYFFFQDNLLQDKVHYYHFKCL